MKIISSVIVAISLAGCAQLQTANTNAKVAVTAIANACQYAPAVLAVAGELASRGAANTVSNASSIITASCTVAGQAALAANDSTPAGVGNSGNSAAWLLTTAADALAQAKGISVKPAS